VRVVLATHNPHKVDEIRLILAGLQEDPVGDPHPRLPRIELVSLRDIGFADDPPETSDTFVGNALQKARFVHQRTGQVCAADDSGIEVDALGGAPGVHSKRFSPEQTAEANNRLLLDQLAGVQDRRARFRCVVAVVGPGGEVWAEGTCEGVVGHAPRGTNGFGYDPLFLPDETPGRTMAELDASEKAAISHRGRAFRELPALLARISG
jgi:XTP/dITP diphosphohydrolase